MLDLAEKIAQKKGLKIVICFDEFQNIAKFTDPDYFQKKLRSNWQQHQNVAYCLYGGKCEIFAQKRANYVKINLENSTNYVKNAYKIMRICDLQIANSINY